MITRPMLAAKSPDSLAGLRYPMLATPKLDGIRCLIVNGTPVTRKFLPLPNVWARQKLAELPSGLDGELMIKDCSFNPIQSKFMSRAGEIPEMEYWVFDYFEHPHYNYEYRCGELADVCKVLPEWVKPILPTMILLEQRLLEYEQACLDNHYEGVIFRHPGGPYKCGRSTLLEQYMVKLKRFTDMEVTVIGFEEMMHNTNEKERDEFGMAKRSKALAGMEPAGCLGKLIVQSNEGVEFKVGTGFTQADRKSIWLSKDLYIGKTATIKYQKHGMKDKPRIPVFKCWRED